MKKDRFNPKHYLDRSRIERTIATHIVRVWVWNSRRLQYEPGAFLARRWQARGEGGKRLVRLSFESLDEARAWQSRLESDESFLVCADSQALKDDSTKNALDLGPTLSELIAEFRKRHFPKLSRGSVTNYEQQIALHFRILLPLRVHEVTPSAIDAWIDHLKGELELKVKKVNRLSFEKELDLLATILRFYDEYWDDKLFKLPLKKRHRTNAKVVRRVAKPERTLSYDDLFKVREAILNSKFGEQIFVLMTVQYRQALRIGEAAALHWEDIVMDFKDPSKSIIRVRRHLDWTRKRGQESVLVDGLKNSAAAGISKELPMFPETFEALKRIYVLGGKGLVFRNDHNTFFEYRSLQHAYSLAFKRAGLIYGGTHNFRHGGCQLIYDRTGGDQALAGQLLGNEDSDTVKIYARRNKRALKDAAQKEWDAMC